MAETGWAAEDFDYQLPDELIAQIPTARRGDSRMLVVDRNGTPAAALRDATFADILGLIPAGDLLVINSTRVRHARLPGTTPGGALAEVLLIHPASDDSWIAMGKPGRAMQPGKQIVLGDGISVETLEVLSDGMRRVRMVGADVAEVIRRFGQLPLPPYITRTPDATDDDRYQTVYAQREGSVAAPTAGLHFTPELLSTLRDKGVVIGELDLEVGPGTFRPLEAGPLAAHVMHAERYEIPESLTNAVNACRTRGGKVWAVGTTVVRALESAATDHGSPLTAHRSPLTDHRSLITGHSQTQLMITPGFKFQVVDHLITNFHLPQSTLLVLVAAFAGYDLAMQSYHHAVAARYRFYSYGDAMCIL